MTFLQTRNGVKGTVIIRQARRLVARTERRFKGFPLRLTVRNSARHTVLRRTRHLLVTRREYPNSANSTTLSNSNVPFRERTMGLERRRVRITIDRIINITSRAPLTTRRPIIVNEDAPRHRPRKDNRLFRALCLSAIGNARILIGNVNGTIPLHVSVNYLLPRYNQYHLRHRPNPLRKRKRLHGNRLPATVVRRERNRVTAVRAANKRHGKRHRCNNLIEQRDCNRILPYCRNAICDRNRRRATLARVNGVVIVSGHRRPVHGNNTRQLVNVLNIRKTNERDTINGRRAIATRITIINNFTGITTMTNRTIRRRRVIHPLPGATTSNIKMFIRCFRIFLRVTKAITRNIKVLARRMKAQIALLRPLPRLFAKLMRRDPSIHKDLFMKLRVTTLVVTRTKEIALLSPTRRDNIILTMTNLVTRAPERGKKIILVSLCRAL